MARGLTHKQLDAFIVHAEEVFARAMRKAMRAATEKLAAEAKLTAALNPVPGGLDPEDFVRAQVVWQRQVPGLVGEVAGVYGASANAVAVGLYNTAPTNWVPPPPPPTGQTVGEQLIYHIDVDSGLPLVAQFAMDSNANRYLTTAANRLVGVGDAAWAAIRDELREGFVAGESIDKLTRRVRNASTVSQRRARVIARTEVVGASNHGAMTGARALPGLEPEFKTWLATKDGRTRPTHVAADGQKVPFEEPFTVGGWKMQHPHAFGAPAEEVVNCRCTVTFSDPADIEPIPEPAPKPVVIPRGMAARGTIPAKAISSMPSPKTAVGQGVRQALNEISKVHRVPDNIATVPVKSSAATRYYGVYESNTLRETPIAIRISTRGDHLAGTFTHEFGHFLDHQANLVGQSARIADQSRFVGGELRGSTSGAWGSSPVGRQSQLMTDLFDAVDASPTMQALRQEAGSFAAYYRSKAEIWARVYHQWIAVRSNSSLLREEIAVIRQSRGVRRFSQWADDEFEPIAKAMDAIFREAGLLK